jgi:pyruvate dehydrogenase E2 component (dihydrolipoamide acetyltransferase)
MATILFMPEVAANATHATVASWSKKEGDTVKKDDVLAEIETDKAVVEFNAEHDGVIAKILVPAGKEIPVGAPIGILLAANEKDVDIEQVLKQAGVQGSGKESTPVAAVVSTASSTTSPKTQSTPSNTVSAQGKNTSEQGRIFASPLAKRIAKDKGVSLSDIHGSGPHGRIVKRDVEAAPVRLASQTAGVFATRDSTQTPHTSMRRTIARRLTESKTTVPHFYLKAQCRVDALLKARQDINDKLGYKVSVNDFVIRAVALALREVPSMNVSWTDDALIEHHSSDISVAVATDGGLITPIIQAADQKSILPISQEMKELASRAKANQLKPAEYQGGTFSISNLGMFGVDEFAAILNPPQAGILAVGAVQKQAVVVDDQLVIGQVMNCTLSVDHRAVDGAVAAQWLAAFRRYIETPVLMLA